MEANKIKPLTIAIGKNRSLRDRTEALCRSLDLDFLFFDHPQDLIRDEAAARDARFVIQSIPEGYVDANTALLIQATRRVAQHANLIAIPEKRIKFDAASFIKKSGAELVLLDDEFRSTTKIDFIISQTLNSDLIPVKASELVPGTIIPFPVLHLLTLNRKMITIIPRGQRLDDFKHERMLDIGEFYIRGTDILEFATYVDAHQTKILHGNEVRCRAKYISLVYTFKQLVVLLTDESEATSFAQGKFLLDNLRGMAADLLNHLSNFKNSWSVVDNAGFGDKTAVDRAPAIAAAAGLLSLQCQIGNPEDVLVGALIGEIGLLDLSPKAAVNYRLGSLDFDDENRQILENHPFLSLNKCLSRRLPISEPMKQIILNSHERVDQKGYPSRPAPDKIPLESMCIQFCQIVDTAMKIEYGKARFNLQSVQSRVLEREWKDARIFSTEFLLRLRENLQIS